MSRTFLSGVFCKISSSLLILLTVSKISGPATSGVLATIGRCSKVQDMNTNSSPPLSPSEQLVTGKEVCELLGISIRALHDYRTRRLIPYVKFSKRCIRYDVTAVKKAIERLSFPSID